MGDNTAEQLDHRRYQVFDNNSSKMESQDSSICFDDDGRPKRTGNLWTASAHIITAVIGSGVLSLAWAIAQLGWIAGPIAMILFSFVTYYTSVLLSACYRSGDSVTGKRNYTYMDAVVLRSWHAVPQPFWSGRWIHNCIIHKHDLHWLSIVAAVMSFTYSSIGLALGVAKVVAIGKIRGSLTGISVGAVTPTQKTWNVVVTTLFYMLCGCFGYAAFGDMAPGNLLTGFGFYNPYWLLDIANVAIVVHLVGAYQVFSQPLYAFVEKAAARRFPDNALITKEIRVPIPIPGFGSHMKINAFRLVWRSVYVVICTVISMLLPFFNDIVGLLGALGFWPLTVYFPVEMYISQKKIPKWSTRWICMQTLNLTCLIVTLAAAAGSVAGMLDNLKTAKPFKTTY
ncbi:hypothetical protein Tsubulata_051000 [Turnera subulata]|uniref:Amino acid transporter transmembrane domain-containing protein n=1 Tax=Turnera subulata TaxID=218843 RepID=A0A9Q0J7N4_9ROSI|nr:hypothetical protein Tsubulata_051000 [Turnera subulata]